jgi:hypothetical protein
MHTDATQSRINLGFTRHILHYTRPAGRAQAGDLSNGALLVLPFLSPTVTPSDHCLMSRSAAHQGRADTWSMHAIELSSTVAAKA